VYALVALALSAAPPGPGIDYAPNTVSYAPVAAAVSYAPGLSGPDNWTAQKPTPRQIAPFAPGSTTVLDGSPHTLTTVRPATASVSLTTTSWRHPVGHTHTCWRCGDTWDHQKNTGHTCQVCGAYQGVQDAVPRMVPIKVHAPAAAYSAPVYRYTIPTVAVPASGCVGGNCPLPGR
jgi:hypothetical protein